MATPTGYIGPPITTHQWLQPLYRWLKGVGGVQLSASGTALSFRTPTGIALGFYGASGIGQPSGAGSTGSAPGGGATGSTFFDFRSNGGTGTNYYTFTDLVFDLKRQGLIAT